MVMMPMTKMMMMDDDDDDDDDDADDADADDDDLANLGIARLAQTSAVSLLLATCFPLSTLSMAYVLRSGSAHAKSAPGKVGNSES